MASAIRHQLREAITRLTAKVLGLEQDVRDVVADLDLLEDQDMVDMYVMLYIAQHGLSFDWEDPGSFAELARLRQECRAVLTIARVLEAWGTDDST